MINAVVCACPLLTWPSCDLLKLLLMGLVVVYAHVRVLKNCSVSLHTLIQMLVSTVKEIEPMQ